MTTRDDVYKQTAANIGEMLRRRVNLTPDTPAFLVPDRAPSGPNAWTPHTWKQTQEEVYTVAAGFISLGLGHEERVAIASSTRHEWILADLAISCAGGATTTVYPNTTSHDVLYVLKDSDSRIFVAENQAQVAKVQEIEELDDHVRHIVILDDDRTPAEKVDQRVITWAQLVDKGRATLAADPDCVERAIAKTDRDTLNTLIYTSGTTGVPKGVELTHGNWTYQGAAMDSLNIIDHRAVQYLWLPLSHVFGKALIAAQLQIGFTSAVDGRVDRIVQGLSEVKPTFMCGVPRIFEKVRNAVLTAHPRKGLSSKIARWAFAVGRESRPYRLAGKPMPRALALRYQLADKLVFSKIKDTMGGRIEFFVSGSAKLSRQVQEWFYSAGITICEGYGSTETSAIAFLNPPAEPHFGTVGPVTPGIEVKIADDGEIMLRGPIIARGYHNRPDADAAAYTADGWYKTGDTGELDDESYLHITDRKKDLIKTSGGKYVAPQKVEAVISANIPYVSQTVAVGEGRKYVVALLTLDRDSLLKWGRNHGHADLDYAQLTQLPEVHDSIQRFMDVANSHLERWETIKRFAILDHEFELSEGGVITPSMKVKRAAVSKKYAHIIDSLYDKDPADEEQ